MIDVTQQINAVRRHVGTRKLEEGEARVVTVSQAYDATIDDVWDACTNPERIPRWFLPVSGDLRLHGRFHLQDNASGTIERCDPPKSFGATWEYGGEVSWIDVRLSPEPNGETRLELEHIARVDDERAAEFGPGAVGVGWDMGFMGLAVYLSSGTPVDPNESAAWAMQASQPAPLRLTHRPRQIERQPPTPAPLRTGRPSPDPIPPGCTARRFAVPPSASRGRAW
jgi:uncharacterized protein YndB with AHSA1/START domain